jgi:DNA-binding LytR/AlgR family response regulator
MKCLIIEDEKIAAQRLKELLLEYDSETEIVEVIQSVRKSVEFFNKRNSKHRSDIYGYTVIRWIKL